MPLYPYARETDKGLQMNANQEDLFKPGPISHNPVTGAARGRIMERIIHLPDHPGTPKDELTGKTQCKKSNIPPEHTSDYYDEVNCINCLIEYQETLQRELEAMGEIDDKKENWDKIRHATLLRNNVNIIRQRLRELMKDV